ncbi:MAG TPA: YgcG family protein [Rhodocyclaceae bacterium]|nr:YgcG family protein [Rhodocyclaceae bacterium]
MTKPGKAPLLILLWLCWSCLAWAAQAIPPLTARVMDRTGTLPPDQVASLERTLESFETRTGIQFAVLLVPTTGEEPIEQYALRAAEQWKLGRKGVDDGALLVVAKDDRAMRIEVGYGLEGALNDATCKRIISEIMAPRFRAGDFYGGISDGLNRMMRVAEGEPLPPPARQVGSRDGSGGLAQNLPFIIVVALVAGGILRAALGRLLGAAATGGLAGILAWWMAGALSLALLAALAGFVVTLFSGFGYRGGWPGGGWGSGGFGSGGFGRGDGFRGGGGGFGGGGASGRW